MSKIWKPPAATAEAAKQNKWALVGPTSHERRRSTAPTRRSLSLTQAWRSQRCLPSPGGGSRSNPDAESPRAASLVVTEENASSPHRVARRREAARSSHPTPTRREEQGGQIRPWAHAPPPPRPVALPEIEWGPEPPPLKGETQSGSP